MPGQEAVDLMREVAKEMRQKAARLERRVERIEDLINSGDVYNDIPDLVRAAMQELQGYFLRMGAGR